MDGKHPEGTAEQLASWASWFQSHLSAQHGRTDFDFSFHLNGWGECRRYDTNGNKLPQPDYRNAWNNAFPLVQHWSDRIRGTAGAGLSDDTQASVVYATTGISLNSEWSRRFFGALDFQLKRRGTQPPSVIATDFEQFYFTLTGDQQSVNYWWNAARFDPRASDPRFLVDGERTFAQMYADTGSIPNINSTYSVDNYGFLGRWSTELQRIEDYILWTAFWQHAANLWPNTLVTNYGLRASSETHKTPTYQTVDHWTPSTGLTIKSISPGPFQPVHATALNPEVYPKPIQDDTLIPNMRRYGITIPNGASHFADLTASQVVSAQRRVVVEYMKQQIDSCTSVDMPVVPWVMGPTESWWPSSNIQDNTDDLIEVMKHGVSRGVSRWLLWHNDYAYDWGHIISEIRSYALANYPDTGDDGDLDNPPGTIITDLPDGGEGGQGTNDSPDTNGAASGSSGLQMIHGARENDVVSRKTQDESSANKYGMHHYSKAGRQNTSATQGPARIAAPVLRRHGLYNSRGPGRQAVKVSRPAFSRSAARTALRKVAPRSKPVSRSASQVEQVANTDSTTD